ncbi:MAG: histidine kinase [Chitinophagaceae bacterium]
MKLFSKKVSVIQLQWIVWLFVSAVMFFVMLSYDTVPQAVTYTAFYVLFYMIIIYGNACWLIPRLYLRNQKLLYVLIVLVALVLLTWLRMDVQNYIYNHFFSKGEKPMPIPFKSYVATFFSHLLVYIFSIAFRLSMDYFKIQREQEALQKRTAEAELNLLKAQVQPHFLFNTLNNIYFVAQRESPATAALVERLSNIMRYFVDEGPRAFIPLTREIAFLQDYIELEKVRMRHPLQVTFIVSGHAEGIQVPPMLMIPLVENVFKHGINKRRSDNSIDVNITTTDNQLKITVVNSVYDDQPEAKHGGNGLPNLIHRLELLYRQHFTFVTEKKDNKFTAQLTIPV